MMDNCRTNQQKPDTCRMYRNTDSNCRYNSTRMKSDREQPCAPSCEPSKTAIISDPRPLAMAYVPSQKYHTTFSLAEGFSRGTIFPELCKPFCGKGGKCR